MEADRTPSAATTESRLIVWPEHSIVIAQMRGRSWYAARDVLSYLDAVETNDTTAREVLSGLRARLEALL